MYADPVREFTITYTETNLLKTARYRSGYPAIEKKNNKSFYEILSDGTLIELIKYKTKVIEEIVIYGSPTKKTFIQEDKLYVFDVKNKKLRPITKGIKSLIDFLPSLETLINQFVRDNELNFKEESSLVLLVQFLNSKN